jgi:hypothetical protein
MIDSGHLERKFITLQRESARTFMESAYGEDWCARPADRVAGAECSGTGLFGAASSLSSYYPVSERCRVILDVGMA